SGLLRPAAAPGLTLTEGFATARHNGRALEDRRELRLVACLFLDVVGSTEATVRIGPERMQRLLAEAFAELSGTVKRHGGIVEKFAGDAILAVFGVPTAHADDTERALRAAVESVQWATGR